MSGFLNRQSPFGAKLWAVMKAVARMDVPVIPGLHHALLLERRFRRGPLNALLGKFYREPLFRLTCLRVGKNLYLYEDMPKVLGNLEVTIGDGCSFSGAQTWIAGGSGDRRNLEVGNETYLGHAVQIVSGSKIIIGAHVLVANRVVLNGYDGHPLDPLARARGEPPAQDGMGPIVLEDYCWIGNDVTILKNVRIGRGAVVASGSLVTESVPDLTVVAGVPAKKIKALTAPSDW
jgi:acetyltransferase-like isoleucine patch superfamily enzyme